jgi:hypothetical protein
MDLEYKVNIEKSELYAEIAAQRAIAEGSKSIKAKAKYHEQIANWLQELDDRRNDNSKIEYYEPDGTENNIKEYNKLCADLKKERIKNKKNKQIDSNVECLIVDKIAELISKMKLAEIKSLKLFE